MTICLQANSKMAALKPLKIFLAVAAISRQINCTQKMHANEIKPFLAQNTKSGILSLSQFLLHTHYVASNKNLCLCNKKFLKTAGFICSRFGTFGNKITQPCL